MLSTNKDRVNQVYECVKQFHTLEELPSDIPSPQSSYLLPTLRPYQVKAVKWMLYKEMHVSYYQKSQGNSSTSEDAVLLPKGGILADEMGLGKTIEVLACILSNPRKMTISTDVSLLEEPQSVQNSKSMQNTFLTLDVVQVVNNLELTGDGTVDILSESCDLKLQNKCEPNNSESKCSNINENTRIKNRKRTSRNSDDCQIKRRKRVKSSSQDQNDTTLELLQETKPKKMGRSENYTLLKSWYENCLSQTSVRTQNKRRVRNKSTFQCCCFDDVTSATIVECPLCNTWQHADCVGYDETIADYQYYCFRCWQTQPPVKSAGTVIISPEAISQQWINEIEKHIKKGTLKVLVYEGVRVTGYLQPHDLASYDIVITTYQVLTKELNYTDSKVRNLRHSKRFHAPTSPLLSVEWWRLCLDEGQMVEGSSTRAAEMAKKFVAVNRWAVTGTPIQKAVNDLLGLMEFLAGKECPEFYALANHDWRSLLMLVPRILWRTQMKDVLEEARVPPQTVKLHMLDFAEIEKYFYKCTHNECSQQFLDRITKFIDFNVTIKSLDRKAISKLMNPLLKLRQACLHPQAVRGKFVSIKKTMTMGDLVTQMIINAKQDAEQALRQLVASLNGSGALHIIKEEWSEAAAAYRAVLHLEQEHKDQLKIDSLQKIHSMHNLAEVLDGGYSGIPPTLRDGTLRQDVQALELRYLGNSEALIKQTEERVEQHRQAIKKMLKEAPSPTLGYSEWFLRLLEFSVDRDELLDRLKVAIQHADVHQKNQYNNLANKLKSLYIVRMEIATWLADLDETRQEVCEWIAKLKQFDKDKITSDAQSCHLSQSTFIKKRNRCSLCQAENALKKYEAMLFEEKSKEKRKPKKRNLPGSSDWKDDKDLDNREIADLVDVNVNTFESSKKGGFKASPFEKILRALATYGRQKQAPIKYTKEANVHLKLLTLVKKEFLDLNLMWRQIFDFVDAKDELNMCKMRIRLPYYDEEEQIENKKRKIGENHHIIPQYRLEHELLKMKAEKEQYEALVKKKVGTLCYLKTLQKEGAPQAICPICHNDLKDKWAVLECGHCVCLECLTQLTRNMTQTVTCPQCRQPCSLTAVSYVETEPSCSQPRNIKGSYSTKVNAVINQTMLLTCQQPNVKIIVFSAWEKVLDLLAEAFSENNITFRRLKGGKLKKRQSLKEFKTEEICVLLLPLRSGAKGLNLVEATHVFLVEPILNPADELQAVGRVHRIGQTRPTVVHRFIVRDTIEERILSAVAESGADQWNDDCITLQQLYDLFISNMDRSLMPQTVDSSSESEDEADEVAGDESDNVAENEADDVVY